jgi:aspartyl-tRNA(Asn)/glutamyl-tRNA(Gln) amidotransferase subunit A
LGEKLDDPLAMYLMDVLTIPCNLAGLPGLSVPLRRHRRGPAHWACRLLGRPFDEQRVLDVGYAWQLLTGFDKRAPTQEVRGMPAV